MKDISWEKWYAIRDDYPYGKWTCTNGREVLYNRSYQPIWERYNGGSATQANNNEWIDLIDEDKTIFYYNDSTPLYKRKIIGENILKEWRIKID